MNTVFVLTHPHQCRNCLFAIDKGCSPLAGFSYCRAGGIAHKPLLPRWWILFFGCSLFISRCAD